MLKTLLRVHGQSMNGIIFQTTVKAIVFSKLFQKYLVKSGTSGEKTKRAKRLHKLRQHNYIKTLQNNCSKKEKTLHNHIKLTKHCRSAVANVQRIVKGCRKQSCPLVSGGWFGDRGFPDFKAYSYSRCRYLCSWQDFYLLDDCLHSPVIFRSMPWHGAIKKVSILIRVNTQCKQGGHQRKK